MRPSQAPTAARSTTGRSTIPLRGAGLCASSRRPVGIRRADLLWYGSQARDSGIWAPAAGGSVGADGKIGFAKQVVASDAVTQDQPHKAGQRPFANPARIPYERSLRRRSGEHECDVEL